MSEWRGQDFRPKVIAPVTTMCKACNDDAYFGGPGFVVHPHTCDKGIKPDQVLTPDKLDAANAAAEEEWNKPLPTIEQTERDETMLVLGNYLIDQTGKWPEFDRFIALGAIARLTKLGSNCGDGAKALADLTREVEAAVYLQERALRQDRCNCGDCGESPRQTPADPPSPPAFSTTTGGATPRRRWWSIRRRLWRYVASPVGAAILAGVGLWLYEGLFGWHS